MPAVSVLITTYNRADILPRAVNSVLKQNFADFELIITDDCSSDNTQEVVATINDPRIRYIRHPENIGGRHGDKYIIRQFVREYSKGDYFVYLCDDDYWIPDDLLTTQVSAMEEYPTLAFAQGSSVFIYPQLDSNAVPKSNEEYITNVAVPGIPNSLFPSNLFPDGFIDKFDYLDMQATDPKNREIVMGATLYRRRVFDQAKVLERENSDVRWQSGYELLAGAATRGDVFFIDRPCVGTTVDLNSASYRGTQLDHMLDCLRSVSAAFYFIDEDSDPEYVRRMTYRKKKMMHSIIFLYVLNKLTFRLGRFENSPLVGIENAFTPEISLTEFEEQIDQNEIPMSPENRSVLALSDNDGPHLKMMSSKMELFSDIGPDWWKNMIRYSESE